VVADDFSMQSATIFDVVADYFRCDGRLFGLVRPTTFDVAGTGSHVSRTTLLASRASGAAGKRCAQLHAPRAVEALAMRDAARGSCSATRATATAR
jgi:hypothetical protein